MQLLKFLIFLVIISCNHNNLLLGNNANLTKAINNADQAFTAKEYEKAAKLYDAIIIKAANNNLYILRAADSYRLSGDCDKAINLYDKISLQDYLIDVKEGKALCYIEKTDFNNAIKLLSEVIAQDATRTKSINALGIALSLNNQHKEALEYYKLAITVGNNNAAILNNLALSQALSGKVMQAINTLQRALKYASNPKNEAKISLNLALMFAIKGDMARAKNIAATYLTDNQLKNNLEYYKLLSNNSKLANKVVKNSLKKNIN